MAQFIKSKLTTYKNKPVGVVASNTGATRAAIEQANFFDSMQKIFWEEAKNDAIKKDITTAKTLAVKDVDGNLIFEKPNFSAVGEDKAKAILGQRYANEVTIKANQKFAELHDKYKFDKDSFDAESDGYIKGFIDTFQRNGMSEYIPEFSAKITNQKVLHSNKILNDIRAREERVAATNMLIGIEDSIKTISALQYDISNFDFQTEDPVEVDILDKKKNELAILSDSINQNINTLVANGDIKAPKANDLKASLRRNVALGKINVVLDSLEENGALMKGVEQIFQSKQPSQRLIDLVIRGARGKVSVEQLQDVHDLTKSLNLSRTDRDVLARHISNRSGDADKLANNLLKEEFTTNTYSNTLLGDTTSTSILKNDNDTRNGIQLGLSKNLGQTFNLDTFFTLDTNKYNSMLSQLNNVNVLPTDLHNLFKTNNFLNLSSFRNATPQQKQVLASRVLNTWNNVAFTDDGQARLNGYNDEYFKYKSINAIASVNGGDIVNAFNIVSQIPATNEDVNRAIVTTVNSFQSDTQIDSVDKALEFVLNESEIPQSSWGIMKPYVRKLLFYKQVKGPNGEYTDFNFDNVKEVLQGTYETMFVEDETVFDLFSRDVTTRTIYSPKRKYVGTNYDKFLQYAQDELFSNTGNTFAGLGEDVFLLPNYKNSQFGDQSYTFVDKNGFIIKGREGGEITFNTIEFDKKNKIDAEELRKQSLNNIYNNRVKRITDSKQERGLYKPKFMNFEYGDMFTPISRTAGGFGYSGFKGGPVVQRQFIPKYTERMLNIPIEQDNVEEQKTEIVDGYEMVNPNLLALDERRAVDELKDIGFSDYVTGLDNTYLENKMAETGYNNPMWKIMTDATVNNLSLLDKLKGLREEFMTPDVAVEIQDNMINIVKTTAKHEGFRTGTYRDRNTISLGFGFNVRYLDEDDYKYIPENLKGPIKQLQQTLLERTYNSKELLQMANDFKRNNVGLPKEAAIKIYNGKMKKLFDTYNEEYENFSTLSTERQSALIDFSYQMGHERMKRLFPKYFEAIENGLATDDIDLRNYYFKLAGFHQVYNQGQFGNTKTPLFYQTARRVKERVGNLGFHIRDNVDFLNEDFV